MDKQNNKSEMHGIWVLLTIIVVIAAVWFMFGRFFKRDVWMGTYERETDTRIYTSQEFSSPELCSLWLSQERQKEAKRPTGRYNFECGMNCKLSPSGLIYHCEKTFDN